MERELADTLETMHPDAFGWALHCCGGDHSRAEEVLQNAYLKIAQGNLRYGERSNFKTWWFGVIRMTAYEEFRRVRYRESLLGKLWLQLCGETYDSPVSPSHHAELGEQTMQLRVALDQLPARQAEVLHLVFYQDLTLSEVASVMKISIGSVRQHYERGKARLRSLLQTPPDHET